MSEYGSAREMQCLLALIHENCTPVDVSHPKAADARGTDGVADRHSETIRNVALGV